MSRVVDSGIMADLLATVPGPSVEIFPPPERKEDVRRPTYETIMKEIHVELEAACWNVQRHHHGKGLWNRPLNLNVPVEIIRVG